jgi:hypothetical protein
MSRNVQHEFKTEVDGVKLDIKGEFDFEGDYEIESASVGEVDVHEILADFAKYAIRAAAVESLRAEMQAIEEAYYD